MHACDSGNMSRDADSAWGCECPMPREVRQETASFGAWLRARLDERAMTAADLARRLGVSSGVVSNWIRGARRPSWESCHDLAAALDLPPDHVLAQVGHVSSAEAVGDELEERLIAMYRRLSPDVQRQVLEFTEWHRQRARRHGGGA